MSDLRFKVMENDIPSSFTCGERSIDALTRTAYNKTLYKQALAYNILVDDRLVGNCMLKVAHICDEECSLEHGKGKVRLDSEQVHDGLGSGRNKDSEPTFFILD